MGSKALTDEELLGLQPKGLSDDELLNRPPSPGDKAKQFVQSYGPYFGTGLGEDAMMYAAALGNPMQYGQDLAKGNYYTGGLPERYQKSIEGMTQASRNAGLHPLLPDTWPQPQSPDQRIAKYAGNVVGAIPAGAAAARGAYALGILGNPITWGGLAGGSGAAAYHYINKLLGGELPDIPHF